VLTKYLAIMIDELKDMLENGEDDEECTEKPTEYAFNTVLDLLIGVSKSSLENFPRGSIYSDCDGGIRIEWRRGDNHLRVACQNRPSDKYHNHIYHNYIYVEEDTITHGKPRYYCLDLTFENLLEKLQWFNTSFGKEERVCRFCGACQAMEGTEKLDVCYQGHPWHPVTRFTGITTVGNLQQALRHMDPDVPVLVVDGRECDASGIDYCFRAGDDDRDGRGCQIPPGSFVVHTDVK
jgi:hypothetical protein